LRQKKPFTGDEMYIEGWIYQQYENKIRFFPIVIKFLLHLRPQNTDNSFKNKKKQL
jgi:hypothetical protein